MTATLRLCWREGVAVEAADGTVRVQGPETRLALHPQTPAVAAALGRLAPPGDDEDRLAESVLTSSGAGALAEWYYLVQQSARCGLLARALEVDGRRLVTLLPTGAAFPTAVAPALADRPVRLSRFALLRREEDRLILESPRAHTRIVLDDDRAAGLVCALSRPATAAELAARGGGLPPDAVARLLGVLATAGMIQDVRPDGTDAEQAGPALAWEFHDLLFHARSRRGRTDAPCGATYRLAQQMDLPPALKPLPPGAAIALARPDLEALARTDAPFTAVLERRRSLREYGARPITAEQLGEFLYRVARVKAYREIEAETQAGPVRMPIALRPYPAGGALYELEFYVAVQACAGLDPGLYYHDPQHHQLIRRRGPAPEVAHLLRDAAASAAIPAERVQVLLILAARFPRLAWKYASIAYALTLKHVGVLYQTMYLTATAMDLAPCALGSGDSDSFARAAGAAYEAETSVGEFLIGSRG